MIATVGKQKTDGEEEQKKGNRRIHSRHPKEYAEKTKYLNMMNQIEVNISPQSYPSTVRAVSARLHVVANLSRDGIPGVGLGEAHLSKRRREKKRS
jgi:hypothetical protein